MVRGRLKKRPQCISLTSPAKLAHEPLLSDMGYTHYWHRPRVISPRKFHAIRVDFEQLILPLADAGVELAGFAGEGPPEMTNALIRFNGLKDCGHPENQEIVIPYPSENAEGIGPSSTALERDPDGITTLIKHRCCNGQCCYETFSFPRSMRKEGHKPDAAGLYIGYTKTAFRPYDIAVTAALLIAKKHLKDKLVIHSNGGDPQWADARRICQSVLGYGDWFGIVEEKVMEEWPGDPPNTMEILLCTLVELNPAALT